MDRRKSAVAGLVVAVTFLVSAFSCGAQTPEQVKTAFKHIRSDKVPRNGESAAEWIFTHRQALKEQLIEELYRTDRQGRDVILFCLFNIKDFKPDQRFINLVVTRINEEDNFVGNSDLNISGHWRAWEYVDKNYALFKPLIIANLSKTRSMFGVWATIWMLQWKGDLQKELPNLDPNIWTLAAASLANDRASYNAGQAVRFYLIIGKASIPYLEAVQKKGDKQAKALASATINAMAGKKEAYGYLGAHLNLSLELVNSKGLDEPDWLQDEIMEQMGKE